MANTQNYNLKKLEYTEIADIPAHFNGNMDIIDNVLKVHDDALVTNLQSAKNYTDQQVNTVNQALAAHLAETATQDNLGHVKVDGVTITVNNGVISARDVPNKVNKTGDTMTGTLNMAGTTPIIFGNKFKIAYNNSLQALEIEVL